MAAGQIVIPEAMPSRDSNGRAVVSRLYFYQNGTTLPAIVYDAADLDTPLAQPVEASAEGRWPQIWADKTATFTVGWTTSTGQPIKTYTGIQPGDGYVVYDDFAHRDLGNVSGSDFRTALMRGGLIPLQDQLSNLYAIVRTLCARICSLTSVVFHGSGAGIDLGAYLTTADALTDAQFLAYADTGTTGWTNVSEKLRQAFADAGAAGLPVDATRVRGRYFIDPDDPILIFQGSGFVGPDAQPCQVGYVFTGGKLRQQINYAGLVFIVDCRSSYKDKPWLARQGGTRITGLQIVGCGLIEDALTADVSNYPTMVVTGTSTPWSPTDHAPIIVTDHRHDSTGALTTQAKAGNTYLQAHIVGVMQGAYAGDPLLAEEPWCASIASGNVTGLSLTEIHLTGFAVKRMLGTCRTTAGGVGLKVKIMSNPVYWTAITQPNSGGLTSYAILKWKQRNCRTMEMSHRAVGFEIDIEERNALYALRVHAGYSADGPTYAAPTLNSAVGVGAIVSAANGDVFRATVAGNYTTQPASSGANYNTSTQIFTDPGSSLRWQFICARQDTGKYNAATKGAMSRINIGGERIITALRVEANAYLHRVKVGYSGHFMDPYNYNGEARPMIDIQTDGRIAGAIDKAVYDAPSIGKAYAIGDKVSDGSNNVFACTVAGTASVAPTTSGGNYNSSTKVFTDPAGGGPVWIFRNAGFKAVGDQPFAVSFHSGIVQETAGRAFENTVYDGHKFHDLNDFHFSIWNQPNAVHGNGAILIAGPNTLVKHINGSASASGNSKRVYEATDQSLLWVQSNGFFGYTLPADGSDPPEIGGNFPANYFSERGCEAFAYGAATGDDDDPGDNT